MSKDLVVYGKFKGFLASRGISYTKEAERLGIALVTFSNKINKRRADFSVEEIRDICQHYQLDANDFFLD